MAKRTAASPSLSWSDIISSAVGVPVRAITREKKVSSLWSSYGSVIQLQADLQAPLSGESPLSHLGTHLKLIAKVVSPPRASGVGHERKMRCVWGSVCCGLSLPATRAQHLWASACRETHT
jgi:hypothetical protein